MRGTRIGPILWARFTCKVCELSGHAPPRGSVAARSRKGGIARLPAYNRRLLLPTAQTPDYCDAEPSGMRFDWRRAIRAAALFAGPWARRGGRRFPLAPPRRAASRAAARLLH